MPPKKSKEKGGGGGGPANKQREIFQAVIIADSFNFRFLPITLQKPRALLPLAGCPLIDYTLKSLISSGAEDIIVMCQAHSAQIRSHILDLKKNKFFAHSHAEVNVYALGENSSMSTGDCLRELDRLQLIRSDFVLVSGDVVSNVNLRKALAEHRSRRAECKSSVMAILMKEVAPNDPLRSGEDDVVLALEKDTSRVIAFHLTKDIKKHVRFNLRVLRAASYGHIRYDLMDCHISICSPEVPSLFTDNFDYSSRDDFIKGALVHEEITGHKINIHLVGDEYAARVANLQTYDAISKNVISRWTYPIVPDTMDMDITLRTSHIRGKNYIGQGVKYEKNGIMRGDNLFGSLTTIGGNMKISGSVIGRRCKIGKSVTITDAYIWDDVVIEDDCVIQKSIICSDAVVKRGVTIPVGCILSYGVTVGPDVALPTCCKVTVATPPKARSADSFSFEDDDNSTGREGAQSADALDDAPSTDESESGGQVNEPVKLGADAVGYVFDESTATGLPPVGPIWGPPLPKRTFDEESDDEEDLAGGACHKDIPQSERFFSEVLESIQRGVKETVETDYLILEINSSKHAYFQVTMEDVPGHVVKAILHKPANTPKEQAKVMPFLKQHYTKTLQYLAPVLTHYIREKYHSIVLKAMEHVCLRDSDVRAVFSFILHMMYELDILDEDSILAWSRSPLPESRGSADDDDDDFDDDEDDDDDLEGVDLSAVRKAAAKLIEWLENADEESDDEDSDDDDEDDEDDDK